MKKIENSGFKMSSGMMIVALLGVMLLTACGGGSSGRSETGNGSGGQRETGGVTFQAQFVSSGVQRNLDDTRTSADEVDVCSEYGIETITARVLNGSDHLMGEGRWPCDTEGHGGRIAGVSPGSGYRVVIEGLIADTVQWRGEISGVSVVAGQTTNAGLVEMVYVGQYQIEASAGNGGAIEPAGTIGVTAGTAQTFTITADPAFRILDVEVDGASVGAMETYTFAQTDADHTIRAVFTPRTYTVTASAGPGGSITPPGEQTVTIGASPEFTITAEPGFYLSAVLINGTPTPLHTPSVYVIENVTADTSIRAEFSAVVYVDVAAPEGGDGTAWDRAFNDMQTAISASVDNGDLWVRNGTYPLLGQITVNKVVQIYGGFAGGEILLADRDAAANPTVFDGEERTRCFFVNADAVFDGLTIKNGRHFAYEQGNNQGGGIYITSASPRISNCVLTNNRLSSSVAADGGAIYIESGGLIADRCRFENNIITNSEDRTRGSAICNAGGVLSISDSIFAANRSFGYGGDGGAIYNNGGTSTITNCRFSDNFSGAGERGCGGAIYNDGGDHTITNSLFRDNNSLADGGAIYNVSSVLIISNTVFLNNRAENHFAGFGGAISNWSAGLRISNTVFLNNRVEGSQYGYGGAIFNHDADPVITNCTFSANQAVSYDSPLGGAIYNSQGQPTIVNSILWGNTAGQGAAVYDAGDSITIVEYSNIDDSVSGGSDNINADPLLDVRGRLRPESPCIGAGDDTRAPAVDIDGEARPTGDGSDMGADEFVDADGDAMPDYWENLMGLDPGCHDSDDDPDGDRLTNLVEYHCDLDPLGRNLVLDASQRGHYNENDVGQLNDSTFAGVKDRMEHRSFFIFPLDGVAGTVTAAILRLEVASYTGVIESNFLDVYDVATDPADLVLLGSSGLTGIFDDLGDGNLYSQSQVEVGPGYVDETIEVPLSESALAKINAVLGADFAVGLKLEFFEVWGRDEFVSFSTGGEPGVYQLVLKNE